MICLLCKKESELVFKEAHIDASSGIEYKLYACPLCDGQFWMPFKNPGAEWYEHDERYAGANDNPPLEPNWNHRKVISFLKDEKVNESADSRKKVLDVGCGTGNFLAHAREEGWEVAGIDFDRNAVAAAQNIFKLPNIEVNDLASFYNRYKSTRQSPFNLITFYDVFEHIDNHDEFLRMIHEMLTKPGYISMSMPYRHGSRWLQPNDLPPRHLTRWDRRSLKNYLEAHGFAVKYIKRVPAPYFYIVMKLRFKYGKYVSFNLVKKMQDKAGALQIKDQVKQSQAAKVLAKKSMKVKLIHTLAKTKDIIIFGIPAALIWAGFLFTRKRYTGLFAIAEKK